MARGIASSSRRFRSGEFFERCKAELAADRLRQTEELLQQKRVLLQEMQHRIGNSLHIIAGILLLKSKSGLSKEAQPHLIDAHRRIMSVAAVQEHLYGARQGDRVEMGPYLSRLCESLADSLVGDDRYVELHTLVGSGAMVPSTAASIGLLVAELVINSLKHAFPGHRDECRVAIAFEVSGSDWRLAVSDNGIGASSLPARSGVGSSLLRALAEQLDAKVETVISPNGRSVAIAHATSSSRPYVLEELHAREY